MTNTVLDLRESHLFSQMEGCLKEENVAGETAQWLRALAILAEFPAPILVGSQPPVTPAPEDAQSPVITCT